jgi:hypothetical protein
VTDVKFNTTSVPATDITFVSDGHLRVRVPVGATSGLVHVTTSAGTGSSSVSFIVDDSAPAVSISTPANDAGVESLSNISGTAADEAAGATGGSGLQQVFVRIRRALDDKWWTSTGWSDLGDNSSVFPAVVDSSTGTWSCNVSATALPAGTYVIYAYAGDNVGNTSYVSHRIFIPKPDVTPPSISMSSPADNSTVSNLASIKGTASDETGGSGLKYVYVRLFSLSYGWWSPGGWSYSWQMSAGSGLLATYDRSTGEWICRTGHPKTRDTDTYYVYAYAVDMRGNTSYVRHRITYNGFNNFVAGKGTTPAASATTSTMKLSSAVLQSSGVQLKFSGALEIASATAATTYQVLVNGKVVEVESVRYEASTRTVTLSLPQSLLKTGDQVEVSWRNLRDSSRRLLPNSSHKLLVRQANTHAE